MKKFLIYILLVVAPVLLLIAGVNYWIDPANVLHSSYVEKIIEGHKMSKNVTITGSNMDERSYKRRLAEINKSSHFEYIVLGSSPTMTLSEDIFTPSKLLNLSVSSCKLEDIMALLQICNDNDLTCDTLIIGIVPTYFNENDKGKNWEIYSKYYNEFNGENGDLFEYSYFSNLFSISYFQESAASIPNKLRNKTVEMNYVTTVINDNYTKRYDGSIYYPKSFREREQSVVDQECEKWTFDAYNNFSEISQNRVVMFEKAINRALKNSKLVIFYMCPMHPIFYDRLKNEIWMKQCEDYIKAFANNNNIKIIGHFNPACDGLKNTDFYDASHARNETVDTIFFRYLKAN